jgi:hypothetical protein
VVLNRAPTDPVIIWVRSANSGEGVVDVEELIFTSQNWNQARTVNVTGVDDSIRDGNVTYDIELTLDPNSDETYLGLDPDDVQVTNQDNDKGKPGKDTGGTDGDVKTHGPKKSRPAKEMAAAIVRSPILVETAADQMLVAGKLSNVDPSGTLSGEGAAANSADDIVTSPLHAMNRARRQWADTDFRGADKDEQQSRIHMQSDDGQAATKPNISLEDIPPLQFSSQIHSAISASLLRCWKADRWPGL